MTVLRMVSLFKRNGSDNWYYRRTIPADVRRILEKATKKVRRRGWYQTHILISTGTPDRAAAKTAGAEIAANVERQFKALRDGPKALNAKQVDGNAIRWMLKEMVSASEERFDLSHCDVAYADSNLTTGSAIALGREADASSTGATTGASSTHLAPAFFRAAARCKRRMF
jgi:hypothetical protein